MTDIYVAVEPCGCVAGATTLTRPNAVADFLKEMAASSAEVVSMPVEAFRSRPPFCSKHPETGPPYWPVNQVSA